MGRRREKTAVPLSPATVRAALYPRVSTGAQVEGSSLKTQKRQLLAYVRRRGYAVSDLYEDAGLSAKNMKRPALKRLLEDAKRHAFEIVLVTKVDRISRSLADLLKLLDALKASGVEFAAVDQDFDTSDPAGLLTLHVLGSFAQFEREIIVERTKEGHLRRLKARDWSCGPVPYGYNKVDGRLVEVPEEAEVVRRIFRRFLKLKNRGAVARTLNEEGLRTRRGCLWHRNTVTDILRNPVYAGCNAYGRHKKGDTRLRPRENWTVVGGVREALVQPEAFEEAHLAIR